jgi:hypothetical protein
VSELPMTLRVVQWTSGGVARQAVRGILAHPELSLVGMYAFSESKAGKDAGELVGLPPIGIKATNDLAEIIALKPDCVSYSPLYPDVDHLVQILSAGINVVTTCNFITGWGLDYKARNERGISPRQRLINAAKAGNASIFGTGINPGHINYLACAVSAHCQNIQKLTVTESVDVFYFSGDSNMDKIGYGLPAGSSELAEAIKEETAVFGDALELMSTTLGKSLDDIQCDVEFAYATEDIDAPGRYIKQGCIAGVRVRWIGYLGKEEFLVNEQVWVVGKNTDAPWPISHGYTVNIQGEPNMHNVMLPIPGVDLAQMTPKDMNDLGMQITALPSINAIPSVCKAGAGICTYNDLTPIAGQAASASAVAAN